MGGRVSPPFLSLFQGTDRGGGGGGGQTGSAHRPQAAVSRREAGRALYIRKICSAIFADVRNRDGTLREGGLGGRRRIGTEVFFERAFGMDSSALWGKKEFFGARRCRVRIGV